MTESEKFEKVLYTFANTTLELSRLHRAKKAVEQCEWLCSTGAGGEVTKAMVLEGIGEAIMSADLYLCDLGSALQHGNLDDYIE